MKKNRAEVAIVMDCKEDGGDDDEDDDDDDGEDDHDDDCFELFERERKILTPPFRLIKKERSAKD